MSLTIKGILVLLVGYAVSHFNLPIGSEALETTVTTIVTLIGAVMAWYGRYRHGDITPLGYSKY